MSEEILNEQQIKNLIEENLNMKFKYDLKDLGEEKRPFGNSGSEIFHDICNVANINKKFNVSDEDELDDLRSNFEKQVFKEISDWIEKNRDSYKIKLESDERDTE